MSHAVRRADTRDVEAWAAMRHQLWPRLSLHGHKLEISGNLDEPDRLAAFVAVSDEGELVGFAEASLRSDYVNGCTTSPVAFVEGVYVEPEHRRCGLASDLLAAVCDWALSLGVSEIASDAAIDNVASHTLHKAMGFEETQRIVFFRKSL